MEQSSAAPIAPTCVPLGGHVGMGGSVVAGGMAVLVLVELLCPAAWRRVRIVVAFMKL